MTATLDIADVGVVSPRRTREGLLLTWTGSIGILVVSATYWLLGSPISGVATSSVALALIIVSLFVPQTVALATVGHVLETVSWSMTFVVTYRTGGLESPGLVWCFLHPINALVTSGRRAAITWALLSGLQLAVVFAYEPLGLAVRHDLSTRSADVMRTAGLVLCVVAVVVLIAGADGARRVSEAALIDAQRTIERQRMLGDMHDGVGGQLLGLMVQVRAGSIDDERLLQGLTSCLDELRLIVDSLDPDDRPLEVAVGELRARIESRCAAAGVDLIWRFDGAPPSLEPDQTLQVLRLIQEATTNALRHSRSERVEVSLRFDPPMFEVAVRDYGVGFDPSDPPGRGRGLTSLRARARRLGGDLEIGPAAPGTRVRVTFPVRSPGPDRDVRKARFRPNAARSAHRTRDASRTASDDVRGTRRSWR